MTTSTKRPDGGELNSEIVRLIDELRRDEGDSVTFISDNPDFNGQPNCAIVCNGDWTGYEDRRFAADTILDALSSAATERKLPTARQVIAESNGHHWVQRFNLVCCRDCGIVRRADDKNSPCKGIVTVELRTPTNESPAPQARDVLLRDQWSILVEKDDRNSPEDYPEMCLITREEVGGIIDAALATPAPQPPVEGLREAFIAGATAVHKEWLASHERGEDHPPRGEPDFSEAATDYAALASPPLTAEPSQVGLNWEISAETKAQIEDIEANTRRAHLNAHNIIAGSPATLTEQSGKK